MRRTAVSAALATALAAGLTTTSRATILSWSNTAGGNFGTAGNWSPAQTPTIADTCQYNITNTYTVNYTSALTTSGNHTFKRGNVTMNVTSAHSTGSIFRIADAAADNVVVNHTAGSFTVNNAMFIANASGSVGTLNVTNSSASFTMGLSSGVVIIGLGSAGSLNVTNAGRFTSAGDIYAGNNAVATGTIQVSGFNGLASMLRTSNEAANLTVGLSGDGRLDVLAGGITSIGGSVILANSTGSSGIVNVSGIGTTVNQPSTLEAIGTTSDITVGSLGPATLTVRDGGRVTSFRDILISPASGGSGTLDVAGTPSHVSRVLVGRNLGVGYNDGELPNSGGNGSLIIGANAVVDVANITQVGEVDSSSTNALLRVNGGQLITRSLFIDEFNVFGTTIDFRDGDIVIDGGSIFFSSNPPFGRDFEFGSATGTPTLTLQAGGTTSLDRMSVGAVSGGGGNAALIITGAGTLLRVTSGSFPTLSVNSPSGFTGSLDVQNGASVDVDRLSIQGGGSFGTNTAAVGAGCFLTTGSIEVSGAGASLTIGGAGSRLTTASIRLGSVGTTGGILTIQSGCDALATSTSNSGAFAVEADDNTTLAVDSGATLTTAGGLMVRGTLNLTGGTINALRVVADMFSGGLTAGHINARGAINANIELVNADSVLSATGLLTLGKPADPAGFANPGGTFIVPGAATVTILDSDRADVGNTQITSPGRINSANGVLIGAGKTLSGGGTVDGAVLNQGTINITGAMSLGRSSSTTGFVNSTGDLLIATGAVATLLDSNAADIGDATLAGTARLTAVNGVTLAANKTLSGAGTVDGPVLNLGRITPTGTGLTFTGALSGVGQLIAGTAIRLNTGGSFTGAGTIDADVITDATGVVTPTGNLTMGRTTSSTGVSIAGTLLIPGVVVTFRDSTQAQLGVLTELRGGLIIGPAQGTNLTGGATPDLLRGVGQITGPLANSGRVEVGLPEANARTGALVISGDYTQSSVGVLDLEIGGSASNARDQLLVNGAATLGGTLNVSTINGFSPHPGDVFQIVACGSRAGTFATINAPGFQIEYLSNAVRLFVPNVCDPDMNQDGNADQDDVAYLVNVIAGAPNPAGTDPDFNHDGNADQDDYISLVSVIAGGACP